MIKLSKKNVLVLTVFLLPIVLIVLAVSKARLRRQVEERKFALRAEDAFAKWKKDHASRMVDVGLVDFRSGVTNIDSDLSLTDLQKQKLITAINLFYECYAGGTFDGFSNYRLSSPYELDSNVVANLLYCLPKNHVLDVSKGELLADLWKYYVSTNRILRVDPESIKITVESITDRRMGIYSKASNYVAEAAVGYLPKAVIVHPTAKEIFQRDKVVIHATVEQFVVTSVNPNSVCPLFVSYYWVDEQTDWLLYEVARISGDFRIIY